MDFMRSHRFYLVLVALVAVAVYAPLFGAFYCGFDDFTFTHRAAFEDRQNPSHIFTTTHGVSAKYRPVERLLDYAVYRASNGNALGFRIRNLVGLLGTGAMLYILGFYLFGSKEIAFAAALLFTLHPLANQATAAALFTIAPAAFILLASLVLLVYAPQTKHWELWLFGSLLCLGLSLFIYEAGIVMLALWAVFVVVKRPPRSFLVALVLGLAVVLGIFFTARATFVHSPPEHGTIGTIIKNLVLFGGGILAAPADSILAHDVFGAPLPSEMSFEDASFLIPVGTGVATLLALALLLGRRMWRNDFSEPFPRFRLALVAASIPLWLVPFLAFTPHASETYLYLPACSASLFMAAFLAYTLKSHRAFSVVVGVLAVIFGTSTLNRNLHVLKTGKIAEHIIKSFPLDAWRHGTWNIRVAEADPPLPRYGLYNYRGLSTIDLGDPAVPATEFALQVATGNPGVSVRVLPAWEMAATPCAEPQLCYWVYADGTVLQTPVSQTH
jgi:hypothetical protein